MSYDRSTVDLTNCDREPIHIPGTIQPHGAMIVLGEDGLVTFVSDNLDSFLGDTNRNYVGAALADVVGDKVSHDIANAVARAGPGHIGGVVLKARLADGRHAADITAHRYEGRTFLEFETPASADDTEVALHLTQSLVRRVDGLKDFDSLFRAVARLVRAMLGYDRVMVYRFLHNGAGRVVAEARDPSLTSFLGQHFPVSDIPVQARKLYVKNWVRVIGDASFVPVPLKPMIADGEPPVDLSHAHLRSVSPIHCEYLRNMGVAASMSISIVVDGELWGLIACHHNTPKLLSIPLRVATELFAQYFSLHVAAIEHRQQKAAAVATRSRLDAIISGVDSNDPVEFTLQTRLREFSSLIASDGAGLWSRGQWFSFGVAPSEAAIPQLIEMVSAKAGRNIWDTQDLQTEVGDQDEYGTRVAGLLAIPISVSSQDFLVFFRSEEAHQIEWAGEPRKAEDLTETGMRLSPRGSFDTWREDVRHKSLPWTNADLVVADAIRSYVRDVMLSHNDATEEQREKNEKQRNLLNSEMTHRVKNILALVKSIAIQTGANAESVNDYTQSFEGRLRALSFAHDQSFSGTEGGELRGLIDAEAGMHRFSKMPDRIVVDGKPVGLTGRAFGVFALLLHEMMTNAAKYGSLSVPSGKLEISWRVTENGDCHLSWVESGGPEVVPPTRRGFGSNLIEKTISHDLGGSVEMIFAPEGLRSAIVLPASHLRTVSEQHQVSRETTELAERPLDGLRVLLVEDQSLIAMDTEELLRSLGAEDVAVAANVEIALGMISAAPPECAVLDLNLGTSTSEDAARELSRLAIPYVFATGYRDSSTIPEGFEAIPVVRKPVSEKSLAAAMSKAIDAASKQSRADMEID
ncbi:HWE histidine kinase domain-containing protein [Aliirhizobium smilacinae]|uniref:HWE histidine kinase domain-containing protein n=1 Tax=Aliirhizobium smilacinae TaxID=1395944 RepID=UPI001FEB688E|nr:HWE histidine kinase domain-containing protein [Rhizobium smilacinae]